MEEEEEKKKLESEEEEEKKKEAVVLFVYRNMKASHGSCLGLRPSPLQTDL